MKSGFGYFLFIGIFFAFVTGLYVVWTLLDPYNFILPGGGDWGGVAFLTGSSALGFFIAFYIRLTHKKQGGELVEDLEDADIDDGDPELGEFSPWSWWPLVLVAGAAVIFLGLCMGLAGVWLSICGLPIVIVGVIGLLFEAYRGNFAR